MRNTVLLIYAMLLGAATSSTLSAQHRLITHGNGRLAIFDAEGSVEWELAWGGIHDVHVLPNGNVMVQRGAHEVVEIERESKTVVWSYDSATQNGNQGQPVEVHAFQPLPDGRVLIAESGPARLIEVDREGRLHKTIPLKVERPHPHMDTRLVRKLASGNYLVCHEGDGVVREYAAEPAAEGDGVVWEFAVPLFGREPAAGHGPESFGNKCFGALRLPSGNTLVATGNGHSVLEVTPEKEIVWKLEQDELEGVRLGWVTTLELLPNGNLVVGNCHAGPGQPLLIELVRATKQVVWTFDRYDELGNSVSNSALLDVPGALR